MKRLILEIKKIAIENRGDFFIIKVNGTTRSSMYIEPVLRFGVMIPEKEMISELFLEFYANGKNALFQSLGSIKAELKILKKEYPNLKKITVKAEINIKSVDILS
jgi:hypothetical protein